MRKLQKSFNVRQRAWLHKFLLLKNFKNPPSEADFFTYRDRVD